MQTTTQTDISQVVHFGKLIPLFMQELIKMVLSLGVIGICYIKVLSSVGIAAETDNIYWLFDGFHNTVAKYNFQDPHPDHEHGGEDHSDGLIYRYDEIYVNRVAGLSSHMVLDHSNEMLYICDTGIKNY